ncbi:MAG: hypothetical protein WC654_04000 [Patescibacteria group bacterium]
MKKTQAWIALFSEQLKKGVKFEEAVSAIGCDQEPDAEAYDTLDEPTRDRIQSFLTDSEAFCQTNKSDARVSFWRRLIPPAVTVATRQARGGGTSANAMAAAGRATAVPTGQASQPVVVIQTSAPPVVSQPPQSDDPIVLTEQALAALLTKGVSLPQAKMAQLRAGANEAALAKAMVAVEAAERKRLYEENTVERKKLKDEAVRLNDEAVQESRDKAERAAALLKAHPPQLELMQTLLNSTYIFLRDSYLEVFRRIRSSDCSVQAQAKNELRTGGYLLHTWSNGGEGYERTAASLILRMIDALERKRDIIEPCWFDYNFITGRWEEKA